MVKKKIVDYLKGGKIMATTNKQMWQVTAVLMATIIIGCIIAGSLKKSYNNSLVSADVEIVDRKLIKIPYRNYNTSLIESSSFKDGKHLYKCFRNDDMFDIQHHPECECKK
jgi:hypothetical protein